MTVRHTAKLLLLLMVLPLFPETNRALEEETPPAPHHITKSEFRARITRALTDRAFKHASIGICIKSLRSGEVIFEKSPNKMLAPASNMKLVTTAAALEKLGKDYRFKTRFYLTAEPDENGIVRGSLVVKGSGDPNISGRFQPGVTALFEQVRDKLQELGVLKIVNGIIIDDSIFDRVYIHPNWPKDQLSEWYCAEVSAVSFNDNCVALTIKPNKNIGGLVGVECVPKTKYVNIKNGCKTVESREQHEMTISRNPGTNRIYITGKYWRDTGTYETEVTVHKPGLYFGTVLKDVIESGGMSVGGRVHLASKTYEEKKDNLFFVMEIVSGILPTIKVINQRSQNFYAEQLFKLLGSVEGKNGSFEEGAKVVEKYLSDLGIERSGFIISDGSGLSSRNRLNAAAIVKLLEHMYDSELFSEHFESLGVSGEKGTSLSKRMTEEPYAGRVHAKTGSLKRVSALSGYVENLDGDLIAFSILINNYSGTRAEIKEFEDMVCRMLVDLKTSEETEEK